jgi:hypothetical protein
MQVIASNDHRIAGIRALLPHAAIVSDVLNMIQ